MPFYNRGCPKKLPPTKIKTAGCPFFRIPGGVFYNHEYFPILLDGGIMQVYAKTDEEIQPNQVYHMSGNQISVSTLDLNLPFPENRSQLDKIAADHFGQ